MTHSDFKDFVLKTLGEQVKERGATLYSSFDTIRKGKLYVMGLNPGGSDKLTIEKSLDLIQDSEYNEYTTEWDRPAGEHPLQKNIRAIVEQFGLMTQDVCASNLIFIRSIGQAGAGYESRHKYWGIHRLILETVKPKIIIAFGNGPISPYRHLSEMVKNKTEEDSIYSGHGKFKCVSFKGDIENLRLTVIGLPHLSRYHLYTDNPDKKKVLDWIKRKE
jgi:hypothetical protein